MIDHATVERIIETAKIEEVLSDYISLKKSGSNLKGVCPFHQEKTPSFMVSPVKGIYKCFGCGKGGNVVNFVMDHENISYPEALRLIAKRYNIEIAETEESEEEVLKRNTRESLFLMNEFAGKFFSEALHKSGEGSSAGLKYFRDRGFRDDIIQLFQLGYSFLSGDKLTKAAIQAGYKNEILAQAGLAKIYDDRTADMFHGRVIFPIHNVGGRIVGFTARVLGKADSNAPKYLNTPETDIFTKGKVLYGLHLAKRAIAQKNAAILVEGNTDVVSLYQSGIENVVAGSGTALTLEQASLIKRFTKNISLIYDNDSAGLNAAMKNADTLLSEGFNVTIIILPEGEDPDSFARGKHQQEIEAFFAKEQKDFILFKINYLKEWAGKDPVKTATMISQIVQSVAKIPDSIQRAVYLKSCSEQLRVDETLLYTELQKVQVENRIFTEKQVEIKQRTQPQQNLPRIPAFVEEIYSEQSEREIIRLMLNYGNNALFISSDEQEEVPKTAEFIIKELKNDDLELKNLVYRKVFEIIIEQLEKHGYIDIKPLVNSGEEGVSELIASLLSTQYHLSKIHRKKGVLTQTEDKNLNHVVPLTILAFKFKVLEEALKQKRESLKQAFQYNLSDEETNQIVVEIRDLSEVLRQISKITKWVVPR
ncbi:MAG: DNA primase [Bacteroidetes bacterium HGW-Bacteroidetes-21]|jgi:DNA primase|nr:MAG: DNA primase [Bacteroidetes bacterium HGW-Bacteroidetes-21]